MFKPTTVSNAPWGFVDPFGEADPGEPTTADDGLEELFYRLEGAAIALGHLEQAAAPGIVLERARQRVAHVERIIELRIKSIRVRRVLDERAILRGDGHDDDDQRGEREQVERVLRGRLRQIAHARPVASAEAGESRAATGA